MHRIPLYPYILWIFQVSQYVSRAECGLVDRTWNMRRFSWFAYWVAKRNRPNRMIWNAIVNCQKGERIPLVLLPCAALIIVCVGHPTTIAAPHISCINWHVIAAIELARTFAGLAGVETQLSIGFRVLPQTFYLIVPPFSLIHWQPWFGRSIRNHFHQLVWLIFSFSCSI